MRLSTKYFISAHPLFLLTQTKEVTAQQFQSQSIQSCIVVDANHLIMDLSSSVFCPQVNSSNVSFDLMSLGSDESENLTVISVFEACNCTTWNSDTQDVRGHLAYMY